MSGRIDPPVAVDKPPPREALTEEIGAVDSDSPPQVTRVSARTKVFISYASADHALADLVQLKLEGAGIAVWRDVASIAPGARWPSEIDLALVECPVLVLILTPEAASSAYVTYEWLIATREDIFVDYDTATFERELGAFFSIEERVPIDGSARTLYRMRRRS